MPHLQVLHSVRDHRIDAQSTLAAISVRDYLALTAESEENLSIQRRILTGRKYYDRLRRDLAKGGTLPPIVLAVAESARVEHSNNGMPTAESLAALQTSDIYIVDGLQRTHHMRLLAAELDGSPDELQRFLERALRVELWTDISFPSILYRMMILNAAQTPMTLRHQLEIVSRHIVSVITSIAQNIEVFLETDARRRFGPRQYKASDLIEGFTAFIKRTPHIESKGIVIEQLDQDDFISGFNEEKYGQDISNFIRVLAKFDDLICEAYPEVPGAADNPRAISAGYNFLGAKPYLLGFCAAVGMAASKLQPEVLDRHIDRLTALSEVDHDDPFGLTRFNQLVDSVTREAGKVGEAQRDLVFHAFRSFFVDPDLHEHFELYWIDAARRV